MDINQILAMLQAAEEPAVQPKKIYGTLDFSDKYIQENFRQVGTNAYGEPLYGKLLYNDALLQSANKPVDDVLSFSFSRSQEEPRWFNDYERIGTLDDLLGYTVNGTSVGGGKGNTAGLKASESESSEGLDKGSTALAKAYLATLLSGGTEEDKAKAALANQLSLDYKAGADANKAAIDRLLADYTKGGAFADSQALMASQQRKAIEKAMPSIVSAMEGAGTQASSMNALMQQQAAERAAESAAALGAEQATKYGDISAKLASILASQLQGQGQMALDLGKQRNPYSDDIAKMFQMLRRSDSKSQSWYNPSTGGGGGGGGGRGGSSQKEPTRGIYDSNPIDYSKDPFFNPPSRTSRVYDDEEPGISVSDLISTWQPSPDSGTGYIINNDTGMRTDIGGE